MQTDSSRHARACFFTRRPVSAALLALVAASTALLSACTTQDAYQIGQGWQREQCRRLQDPAERARCEKSTAISYEKYRADAEAVRQPAARP